MQGRINYCTGYDSFFAILNVSFNDQDSKPPMRPNKVGNSMRRGHLTPIEYESPLTDYDNCGGLKNFCKINNSLTFRKE